MAAPRLLDKKLVAASLAHEKKQQIEQGIVIAKKVDAIRSTLQEEETKLERFRAETIARVQIEIDVKIRERDQLLRDIERVREERFRLQAPLDLKAERDAVREQKRLNETWEEKLTVQQVSLLARESDYVGLAAELSDREEQMKAAEELADRTLGEAQKRLEEASVSLESSKEKAHLILTRATTKEKDVVIRENEVRLWNDDLTRLETELKEKEVDLVNRERALKDKYETFVRAQNYIKTKQ